MHSTTHFDIAKKTTQKRKKLDRRRQGRAAAENTHG